MILESSTMEFSDAQSLTIKTGETVATNTIDLQVTDPNQGAGTPVYLIISVNTVIAPSISVGMYWELEDSVSGSAAWLAILRGETRYNSTAGELDAGQVLFAGPIPAEHQRYLQLVYTSSVTTLSAGKMDAYLSLAPPREWN